MGGHQRGGASPVGYPKDLSPDEYMGNKVEMDTDKWTAEGNSRMVWSIGNDWVNGSGASQYLAGRLREAVTEQHMAGFMQFLQVQEHAILDWPKETQPPFFNINDSAALAIADAIAAGAKGQET